MLEEAACFFSSLLEALSPESAIGPVLVLAYGPLSVVPRLRGSTTRASRSALPTDEPRLRPAKPNSKSEPKSVRSSEIERLAVVASMSHYHHRAGSRRH